MKDIFESKVVYKNNLTEDLIVIGFKAHLNFKAGQFFHIILDENNPNDEKKGFRPYSILNSPKDSLINGVIYSYIKLIPNGLASEYIKKLNIGDKVLLRGPYGKFLFDNTNDKHIFLCTGTGIAPINSIIDEIINDKNIFYKKIILIHSARTKKELLYFDKFINLHNENVIFYIPTLTRPEPDWDGNIGRITENNNILSILEREVFSSSTYLCGLKEFISDLLPIFRNKTKNIIIERYD
ncbi:MAG: FAD-binding oxidoreductase [Candidatus Woesearchaeota archaeon]